MDINFYCSPSRANKKGLADIVVTIGIKGYKRLSIALPMKYNPALFTREMESSKGGIARSYCENVRNNINSHINDLIKDNKPIEPDEIKEFVQRGCVDKTYTLDDLFGGFLSIQFKRVGSEIKDDMYDRYVTAKKTFYEDLNLKGTDAAEKVTYDMIVSYKAKLLKTLKASTVATRLNRIKAVFRYGFNIGKLKSFPFQNIILKKGASDEIKYLTQAEIEKIKDKEFATDRLTKIRDIFLFQCYSGLAYIDMKNLTRDDVKFDDSSKLYYIKKKRQKTGVEFFTILLGSAVEIITKYDFQLPVPSNQKVNAYLKEIGDICGIEKNITSHSGRHSFAVLLLNEGFSRSMVAKCLGHSDERMTERYAKILDTTLLDNAGQIQKKLIKKEIEKILLEK